MKITIDDAVYSVVANEDETFGVVGPDLDIVIQPFLNDLGVTWGLVSGVADLDLVAQIGELIEDYEM